jgi:DNA-binding response OmpR family regulator
MDFAAGPVRQQERNRSGTMSARILVVDDNEDYLAMTKALLDRAGYETVVASSFEGGKRELQDRAPDLLILDVRLGAFNGLQLISTGQVQIPTIVVTGFDDPVLRADAHGFGASYLVKPVSPAALLAVIAAQLPSDLAGSHSEMEPRAIFSRMQPGHPACRPLLQWGGVRRAQSNLRRQ